MTIGCVVVGVDGSANAQRALEWAIALAEPLGARVVAVHALGLLDRLHDARVPTAPNRPAIVAQFEQEWCAPLAAAGVDGACVADDGTPADVILRVAQEHGADVIVVGARGVGAAAPERLLGSTSHRVVEQADRPVLVVPEAGRR